MKKTNFLLALGLLFVMAGCNEATSQNTGTDTGTEAVLDEVKEKTSEKSGDTYLYTYKLTTQGMGSDTKIYISDHGMRSEMSMKMMGREMNLVTLALKSNPGQSVILNEKEKSYAIRTAEDLAGDIGQMAQFQKTTVEVIGKEKVKDFNCTHIIITTKMNIPGADKMLGDNGNAGTKQDMWLTKDISGYDLIAKYMEANPKMMNIDVESAKIAQYGVPVKQVSREEGVGDIINELVSVEKVNVSKDKFDIPKGFVKSDGLAPGFNPGNMQ